MEGALTRPRITPRQLGEHRVVGGQFGVVVTLGRPVQPLGGALVAAAPLNQQRDHHHDERNFTCRPSDSTAEPLIAEQIGMPTEMQ